MNESLSQTLWQIHHERESHFNEPSIEDLTAAWVDRNPTSVLSLPSEIYGVAEVPQVQPTAIVSLDLCEVVRETGLALLQLRGGNLDDMVVDKATGYMDYGSHLNGWHDNPDVDSQIMVQLMLQEFMHHDHVAPMPLSTAIGNMLRKWRAEGAYVIANTSTLPGCELSTIRFLDEVYPGCVQGILLPRNHDGLGKVTKIQALEATKQAIIKETGYDLSDTPVIAIDDAFHHAESYDKQGVKTFMPAYDWNEALENVGIIERIERRLPGTIDTFIAVDQYLADHA